MCDGRRYLDAVLGRDLRAAPSRVRPILEGGGPTPPSSAGHLPAFSKNNSYKPPGVWIISILPTPLPTFLWACRVLVARPH